MLQVSPFASRDAESAELTSLHFNTTLTPPLHGQPRLGMPVGLTEFQSFMSSTHGKSGHTVAMLGWAGVIGPPCFTSIISAIYCRWQDDTRALRILLSNFDQNIKSCTLLRFESTLTFK